METSKFDLGRSIPLVRAVPEPPGLFIRARREDKTSLLELFLAGTTNMSGIVFDPTRAKQDRELKDAVLKRYLEAVLDPKTQQLATPHGFTKGHASLPWGAGAMHKTEDFSGVSGRKRVAALADFALMHGYTAVLAPTHLIRSSEDPWFSIDLELVQRLREELDRRRGSNVSIFYELSIPYAALRDQLERKTLVRALGRAPIDQLWLKVDGLGGSATPAAVANYLDASLDFHQLELPLIADHLGGYPGLALVAMGAVTGLCHGVTLAEQFDSSTWMKQKEGDIYSLRTRAYAQKIDLNLDVKFAKTIFEQDTKVRALLACHDRSCCDRGMTDMLQKPGKHFLFQRMQQVSSIGRIPASLRAHEFVSGDLRRVTENLIKAKNLGAGDEAFSKRLVLKLKRLDGLRTLLTKRLARPLAESTAATLVTRRAREAGTR